MSDTAGVQIRIEGSDLPGRSCGPSPDSPRGYHNIHVAVQRRNKWDERLGLVPADAPSADRVDSGGWGLTVDVRAVAAAARDTGGNP